MQVSPRVAAPADWQDFVEIRYFRFGAASVSAAFLFGLTECAKSARFSSVRQNFLSLCGSKELKSLLEQALSCPSSTLLQAWNYSQELYTRLRKGLNGLTLLDEEVFPIQLAYDVGCTLKVDGVGEETGRDMPVLEIFHIGGEVVLGYRVYSKESMALSDCQHIHLKSGLFRAFRESSQGLPLSLSEASDSLFIRCYSGCDHSLIPTIYRLAATENQIYSLSLYRQAYFRLQNSIDTKHAQNCDHSLRRDLYYECKHEVCWACVVIWVVVSRDVKAECCGKPVKREFRKEIWMYVREMKGIRGDFAFSCAKCDQEMLFSSDFISLKLKHNCLLCDNCLLLDLNRGISNGFCPFCKVQYIPNDIIVLSTAREGPKAAFNSLGWSCEGSNESKEGGKCSICRNSLSRADFSTGFRLQDSCLVCERCRLRGKSQCPLCQKGYSESDQMAVNALSSSFPAAIPSKKCICGNIISSEGISCPGKCYCGLCLLRHYVADKIENCPRCNEAVVGNLPGKVQCSGCFRPLQPMAKGIQSSVFSVCSQGCILCCYCIRLPAAAAQGSCPLCSQAVSSLEWLNVETAQNAFPSACVCGSPEPSNSTLECGHPVHPQCLDSVYNCRLCWQTHKARNYFVTLKQYLISIDI